jgi:hypothetical protein
MWWQSAYPFLETGGREMSKAGFIPISFEEFAERHLASNPGEDRATLTARLRDALEAYKRGVKCQCGEPLWVIGSAVSEYGCFTCITMEATPDSDYEIDEACE